MKTSGGSTITNNTISHRIVAAIYLPSIMVVGETELVIKKPMVPSLLSSVTASTVDSMTPEKTVKNPVATKKKVTME